MIHAYVKLHRLSNAGNLALRRITSNIFPRYICWRFSSLASFQIHCECRNRFCGDVVESSERRNYVTSDETSEVEESCGAG